MVSNNAGTIYNVLEKAGNIMRDDIKSLSDFSAMVADDISKNFATKNVNDSIEKNKEILHEIESMAKSLREIDNLFGQKISENGESNIVIALLTILNLYGMIDISYSAKGKITIDIKHCQDIEKL